MLTVARLSAACLLLATCACTTTLQVTKVDSSTPPPGEWTYSLPFEQFDVTATRTFKGCKDGPLPIIELKVSAQPSIQPDPDQTYSIDPDSLVAFSKISDLKITWFPNSAMLQTVNASAEDRTGQIISNVVTSLATIATTVASGGVGGVQQVACKTDPELQAKLDAQAVLDSTVKSTTDTLDAATTRLKVLTALASAGGTQLDQNTSTLLLDANTAVSRATAALKDAVDKAAANQKDLTATSNFFWPKSGMLVDHAQQVLIPGGLEAAIKFKVVDGTSVDPSAATQFSASLRLEAIPSTELSHDVTSQTHDGNSQTSDTSGLRYRAPVAGHLVVCIDTTRVVPDKYRSVTEAPSGTANSCGKNPPKGDVIMHDDPPPVWAGTVPQLGQLKYFAYSNGPFQSNVMAATFNQDGSLASAEYQEKTSRGETLSAVLSDATKAGAAGAKGVVTGPTDLLQAKVDQLKARNDLITQQTGLMTAEQIGLLQANTSLLKAQAAFDDAQVALQKSETALKDSKP